MLDLVEVVKKAGAVERIATPSTGGALGVLHTFDESNLETIAEGMPEIVRASRSFGRRNSQVTNKLMSLNMLHDTSPMRVLRECVAMIENRRMALKENVFNLRRDRVKLEMKLREVEHLKSDPGVDRGEVELAAIDAEELAAGIQDRMIYIEGALKDIRSFQSAYEQIRKNNGLPENWDEEDFEMAEIRSHIRFAFTLGYRNVMSAGRFDAATLEYLQQFGIHPQYALAEVQAYIKQAQAERHEYEDFEKWLDAIANKFKDRYKQVMRRLGLVRLLDIESMYLENKEPNPCQDT